MTRVGLIAGGSSTAQQRKRNKFIEQCMILYSKTMLTHMDSASDYKTMAAGRSQVN